MCGALFTKAIPEWREIMDKLGLPGMDIPECNNLRPSELIPFAFVDQGRLVIKAMRWGLHPRFASEPPSSTSHTHWARIETIETLSSFRDAVRYRRGFVPASGFIEWRKVGKISEPFFIDCENQGLVVAGIWDVWGDGVYSFSVITQPADESFKEIHSRMPLTLTADQLMRWLDPRENVHLLLEQLSGATLPLRKRHVDFTVNDSKNKQPPKFVDNPPEQPTLF